METKEAKFHIFTDLRLMLYTLLENKSDKTNSLDSGEFIVKLLGFPTRGRDREVQKHDERQTNASRFANIRVPIKDEWV